MSRGATASPDQFVEVLLDQLEPGDVLGFDLFVGREDEDPVLYHVKNQEFTREIQERLIESGATHLWTPVEQLRAYDEYRERRAPAPGADAAPRDFASRGWGPTPADPGPRTSSPRPSLTATFSGAVHAALADLNTPGLSERVQRVAEVTARALLAAPQMQATLLVLLELDAETYNHSTRTAFFATVLASAVGLAESDGPPAIGRAGLLHDIGKTSLPKELLHRPPEGLTGTDRERLRDHTQRGVRILRETGFDEPASLDVCANHHERWNGSGYPRGLREEEISLPARIVAIADVFDALTSLTRRRAALSGFQALWRMKQHMTGCFDPRLLAAFVEAVVGDVERS